VLDGNFVAASGYAKYLRSLKSLAFSGTGVHRKPFYG